MTFENCLWKSLRSLVFKISLKHCFWQIRGEKNEKGTLDHDCELSFFRVVKRDFLQATTEKKE